MTYTKTEQEIIVLLAAWSLIDDMVNYQNFVKGHGTVETNLKFKEETFKRVFSILLVDFLSKPKCGTFDLPGPPGNSSMKTDHTFLFYLRRICANPILNVDSSSIHKPVQQFIEWLEGECFVEKVWFPSIKVEVNIREKRIFLLRICGNIAKHNFARLEATVKDVRKVLKDNGEDIDVGKGFLILREFYEWFNSVLEYQASTIAEHLNNIRLGIFDYLSPEYSRSDEMVDTSTGPYQFKGPKDCDDPMAQEMYYELMNKVRGRPSFPRFTTAEWLKKRY
ncbi:MAG: hypothetical protein IH995_03530 [Proteobacteria bacterium]|nr:hypothetical protein [Pseudomonadota bacterium]